jgi:TldD protein
VGHGLEADFNRKKTSNYTDQIGKRWPRAVHGGRRRHPRQRARLDQRRRRGQPGRRNVLIENGMLVGYMQDRISARHFGSTHAATGGARASATSRCRA